MTAATTAGKGSVSVSGPGTWVSRVAAAWRGSLRVRMLTITLVLTALTIMVALVWMSAAIQNDLFESRVERVQAAASEATLAAQETLDASEVLDDPFAERELMETIRTVLTRQGATDMVSVSRISTVPSSTAPQGFVQGGLPEDRITSDLRALVHDEGDQSWWQSVSLTTDSGDVPGIIIGQQIVFPESGAYEVYFAYDLASEAQTLQFVQVTLWLVGVVLVILIGGIMWFVLRSVTEPIATAADTSAKLAAGDLQVRLAVKGEDEFATLGRSFNAMADSIEAQIKELAELSLVQQRFVSDVSHELRTPLTTIRLAADVLNDEKSSFDPGSARATELLHAQVLRFETLLGDLLEISRYDAGSLELEMEPTSLAHLAEDVIASMAQLAESHGTDVRLVAPGGYSSVEMDPRRIRRIVRNLLGNAIEHGEGLPLVVTVDSNRDAVALAVRDFGMGMRAEDTERVFDRFLACGSLAAADDRGDRSRALHRAGGCEAARRDPRRVVGARSRDQLRPHPAALPHRRIVHLAAAGRPGRRHAASGGSGVDSADRHHRRRQGGRIVRRRLAALAVFAVLSLAACAGLPTSGTVHAGSPAAEEDTDPDFFYQPDAPATDATPQQIVEGFLAAGSDPRGNWGVASQYLTENSASAWSPQNGVTIYQPNDTPTVAVTEQEDTATVTVNLTASATVDATGVYSTAGNLPVTLDFTLEKVGGQWRISATPDGIVLDSSRFRSVFRSYSLMYFDPTWTYLVPDERWFPTSNPATRITQALIEGSPSPWLVGSVASAFSDTVGLASQSVPVRSFVARVSLTEGAVSVEQTTRDRMLTQLQASLDDVGVDEVELVVDDRVLEASTISTRSIRVDQRPLVVTADGFGFAFDGAVEGIGGLSETLAEFGVDALELDADRSAAAVLDTDGNVRRVTSGGDSVILDDRTGLIAPTIDAQGFVWSVPAGSPSSVLAFPRDGAAVEVQNAWPGATRIIAMQVSRDGTRIAAVLSSGGMQWLWVTGIDRDGDGVPVALNDGAQLLSLSGTVRDLTWIDATTLGVLETLEGESYYIEQVIGGSATRSSAPEGAVSLSAGNPVSDVRVLTSDGQLHVRRGSTWLPVLGDVLVLGKQQGVPR